jgi:ribonuclease G
MRKEIIINSTINEVRVAITEDGQLAEFFIEFPEKERYIGNVYLGKVSKVMQGINAAFIDIGLRQDAFLHFSDVDDSLENNMYEEDDDEDDDIAQQDETETDAPVVTESKEPIIYPATLDNNSQVALRRMQFSAGTRAAGKATFVTKRSGEVQINLEPKQDVIVQVVREAYGHKGVKVTTKIALPGRYVVLLPFDNILGVSKKIHSYQERRRLRQLARKVLPKGSGCIIRTAAKGKSEVELEKDWEDLLIKWQEIEQKVQKTKKPGLLYKDMKLAASVIRDLLTPQVQRVVVDSKKLYKEIYNYLKWSSPKSLYKLELYAGARPIFDAYGIEKELAKTYRRKVNLPSGGDIAIEQTEAMFVVDVNSGRAVESDQEKNAVRTNMEAAREMARQIRLRDMAGMIIIDFIDMAQEQNRRKLYVEMKRELAKDRAKTVVYPLTQLGLLQITRQRINQNIAEKITETCPTCSGTGRITSKAVLINSIERWLRNFRKSSREFRILLTVNPSIAQYLTEGTISPLHKLMLKYFVKIKVVQNEQTAIDKFRFFSERQQKDITNDF